MEITFEGDLVEGIFKKRLNRFVAEVVIDGKVEIAHVPNTGRMKEILIEGARIIVRRIDDHLRKTKYDLLLVYYGEILVAIDSKLPNKLLYKGFISNAFQGFKGYNEVHKEVTYGNSRLDFGLVGKNTRVLIETKCVTYVEDGIAKFPDAPTTRGTRHVLELIHAQNHGIEAAIIFIIQRNDAEVFIPNWDIDPNFSLALEKAYTGGLTIKALVCDVSETKLFIEREIEVIMR